MLRSWGVRIERIHRQSFVTIDDCLPLARQLAAGLGVGSEPKQRLRPLADQLAAWLTQLAGQKYPLDVRRGMVKQARREVESVRVREESRQVKAGSRTYFLDVVKSQEGKEYLKITESRFKGESKERERSSVIVFPEHAQEFATAVAEVVAKLSER